MADVPNRTLGRGLAMLELLGRFPDGLALFELAQHLNLPRSTAFNLARTLTDLEYAWFDPGTNRYRLGLRMFEVGSAAVERIDILSVSRGCMSEIYQQINETMHLGVRTEADVVYLDKIESTRSIRMTSYVGRRVPMYCTALGKALLAEMTDGEIAALYRRVPMVKLTENTAATAQELAQQLKQVRETGFAVERDESVVGVSCAAVALKDQRGRPMYAISVSVPSFRVEDGTLSQYGALLLTAKMKIERFARAAGGLEG